MTPIALRPLPSMAARATPIPDNGGAWFGRGDLWYGHDRIDEGIHDYDFAKSLGHPGAQEQLTYLWGIKADRSLAERRANGTLNAPPSGPAASGTAGSASRYCMRCYGTGGIYAWEDGTDAYNHRVRRNSTSMVRC